MPLSVFERMRRAAHRQFQFPPARPCPPARRLMIGDQAHSLAQALKMLAARSAVIVFPTPRKPPGVTNCGASVGEISLRQLKLLLDSCGGEDGIIGAFIERGMGRGAISTFNSNKMTTRVSTVSLAAGLAILAAILCGWWYGATGGSDGASARSHSVQKSHVPASSPNEPKIQSGETPSAVSQSRSRKSDDSPEQRTFLARLAQLSLTGLLAEFELTDDARFLAAAKAKHGNEPLFLIVAALLSKTPESEALTQLEASQPHNALPNILRAGMYADQKNWKEMAEQLQLSTGKPTLTLGRRERTAALLDVFIADQSRATPKAMESTADRTFFLRLDAIGRALGSNPSLFGSSSETSAVGIGLAMRLRDMGEHNFMSRVLANGIEGDVLSSFDNRMSYGDSGRTIGQRYDELNAMGRDTIKYMSAYRAILDPRTDSRTRTQFFARARADGEVAALQWFEAQRAASN
jgi:hypothetical protein